MKKNYAKYFIYFLCSLSLIVLFGCGTIPTEADVPQNLTPIEIKQLAQEEFDDNNIKGAIAYYEILLGRYGSDMSVRCSAEYEIAHLYIKQKKWVVADDMLKTIISRYEAAGGAGLVPKYYILAKKDYEKTQKHLSK